MLSFAIGLAAGIAALALLCWCAARGFRDGDRPGDATVRAVLRDAGQPDEPRPVIVATVVNPSGAPVLAGLSARPWRRGRRPGRAARFPLWPGCPAPLASPLTVTVPRRTARAKFRPAGYAVVGVVPASGTVRFPVPVDCAARRYLLTAAVGQADGRLRVHRLLVAGDHDVADGSPATLLGWRWRIGHL